MQFWKFSSCLTVNLRWITRTNFFLLAHAKRDFSKLLIGSSQSHGERSMIWGQKTGVDFKIPVWNLKIWPNLFLKTEDVGFHIWRRAFIQSGHNDSISCNELNQIINLFI